MAILHYQRLGVFGVNIDDGFPLSENDDDNDQHEGETTIEEIAEEIEDSEDKGDDDEPLGTQ